VNVGSIFIFTKAVIGNATSEPWRLACRLVCPIVAKRKDQITLVHPSIGTQRQWQLHRRAVRHQIEIFNLIKLMARTTSGIVSSARASPCRRSIHRSLTGINYFASAIGVPRFQSFTTLDNCWSS